MPRLRRLRFVATVVLALSQPSAVGIHADQAARPGEQSSSRPTEKQTAVPAPGATQTPSRPTPPQTTPVAGQTSSIRGRAVDDSGAVLPGVTITVSGPAGNSVTVVSGADGSFSIPGLPIGRYRARAELPGFKAIEQEVQLNVGSSASLEFNFGIVPAGTPKGGGSSSPSTPTPNPAVPLVSEHTFNNDAELQTWLNAQAASRRTLIAVVPKEDKVSVFVFSTAQLRAGGGYLALSFNQTPTAADLESRIKSHPAKTFVGAHRVSKDSWLLVFRE